MVLREFVRAVLTATGGVALGALLSAAPLFGQGISIGSGARLDLGSGRIDLGCTPFLVPAGGAANLGTGQLSAGTDVGIAGLVAAGAASVQVSGDWTNAGTFQAGTSVVALTDGCGRGSSTVSGHTTFAGFTGGSTSGRALVLAAGSTQRVTGSLTLAGTTASRLVLRSSTPGSPAYLDLANAGTQSIAWVDVRDNHALDPGQWIAAGPPPAFGSVDRGGNRRWFLGNGADAVDVPALSGPGMGVLAGALFAAFCTIQRKRRAQGVTGGDEER